MEGLEAFYEQELAWSGCQGGQAVLECATLNVPVDYDRPAGDTLGLAVVRRPAHGSQVTIGSLVVNVGGPGRLLVGSPLFPPVSAKLQERFHVVGYDARGVGGSGSMQCLPIEDRLNPFLVDGTPDTAEEVTDQQGTLHAWAQACEDAAPDLLPHLGTEEGVQDLDVLRAALGEEDLHYHGLSYGTRLGAEYAARHPNRVGRMALVSLVPTTSVGEQRYHDRAVALDTALGRALDYCLATAPCPLGADRADADARLRAWLEELDQTSLRDDEGRVLSRELALVAVELHLGSGIDGYGRLVRALDSGYRGFPAPLWQAVDDFAQRVDLDATVAVGCLDEGAPPLDPEQTRVLAEQWEQQAPVFGEYYAWKAATDCRGWPAPTYEPAPRPAEGTGPVLLVTSVHDPWTPHPDAADMQAELPEGVLLRYDGAEHSPELVSGCVREAVEGFLLQQELPPATCPAAFGG